MLQRIFYTLANGWRLRDQLSQYVRDPGLQLPSLKQLSLQNLAKLDIKVLVLDYDGVLTAHGELQPRDDLRAWLQALPQHFTGQIYVLSNKPTPARQQYFAREFPGIGFIVAMRKKPYPDGLQQIMQQAGVAPRQLLIVDDRLLTGILSAVIIGAHGLWITRPYINIMARPFTESWFILLRWLERSAVKIIKFGTRG
jgi:HAD superfamily phosphatase (TIGR01668 family)